MRDIRDPGTLGEALLAAKEAYHDKPLTWIYDNVADSWAVMNYGEHEIDFEKRVARSRTIASAKV